MKHLNVAIAAVAVVIALGGGYAWMQNRTGPGGSGAAELDTAAVYDFCTAYQATEAHCACSVEQAKKVFADHDWEAIRIMHREGVEAMQIHMAENYDDGEWDAFVDRMNQMDALTAANCPPM